MKLSWGSLTGLILLAIGMNLYGWYVVKFEVILLPFKGWVILSYSLILLGAIFLLCTFKQSKRKNEMLILTEQIGVISFITLYLISSHYQFKHNIFEPGREFIVILKYNTPLTGFGWGLLTLSLLLIGLSRLFRIMK